MNRDIFTGRQILLVIITLTFAAPQLSLEQQPQNQSQQTSDIQATKFRPFSNSEFGIKMQYPSNWTMLDFSGSSSSSLLVAFGSPIGGPVGSVNIIAEKAGSQNTTFSKFVSTNINNLKQSGKILKLISSAPALLDGNTAYKIEYTTNSSRGIPFTAMQIFSLVGNQAYFFTYAAPSDNYGIHLQTVQMMIKSFRINK